MSEKEDILRRYEHEVKNHAANLANDILADPYCFHLDRHTHEFRCRVKSARERRERRLAKLETVKISRRHLQVLTDWFVKAVKGYDQTNKSAYDVLGRNPACFTSGCSAAVASMFPESKLCQACQAIKPLLKDDC